MLTICQLNTRPTSFCQVSFMAVELSCCQWINSLFILVCRETKEGKFEEVCTNDFVVTRFSYLQQ